MALTEAQAVYDALNPRPVGRRSRIVLDRETCDWVIDPTAHTAMCRTHLETWDGPESAHFPEVLKGDVQWRVKTE